MTSRAHRIALAISNRLALISTDNGYRTNIGQKVSRGVQTIDTRNGQQIVFSDGDDKIAQQVANNVKLSQAYAVEGYSEPADMDNPLDTALNMIADIKQALWGDPEWRRTLGLARGEVDVQNAISYGGRVVTPRAEGSGFVGAGILITVTFAEDLANP